MGVFYTESPASRMLCAKSRADTFELLVLNTSIIRPASNRYIRVYLERLHGAPYEPLDPVLRDTLAETFGVMVYQEDVVNVCAAFAGMPLATADGLRKSLSKKRPGQGARRLRRGVLHRRAARWAATPRPTKRVWAMIMSFAGYSFCKGHSASYIQVAQHSCYLRAHYPAEFMAAVLANGGGFYHPFAYVAEAMRMGLTVLPPDVNASEFRCTGQGRELRIGLQFVKELSAEGAERVLAAGTERRKRREDGTSAFRPPSIRPSEPRRPPRPHRPRARRPPRPHQGRRARLDRRRLDPPDDALAGGLDRRVRPLTRRPPGRLVRPPAPRRPRAQGVRPRAPAAGGARRPRLHHRRPPDAALRRRAPAVPRSAPAPSCTGTSGEHVLAAGMLTTAKPVHTLKDEPMEFATFDDGHGLIETVLFPDVYRERGHVLFDQGPFIFRGKVEEEFGAVTLTVTHLDRLERMAGEGWPRPEDQLARPGRTGPSASRPGS